MLGRGALSGVGAHLFRVSLILMCSMPCKTCTKMHSALCAAQYAVRVPRPAWPYRTGRPATCTCACSGAAELIRSKQGLAGFNAARFSALPPAHQSLIGRAFRRCDAEGQERPVCGIARQCASSQ